jgi:outer membrane protein assembly factor BamA
VGGALIALGLTVPAAAHGQLRGDEVKSVRFEGNATFPSDSLARAIVTQRTSCRSSVLAPFCVLGMGFALRRSQIREREIPFDRARLMIWYQRRGFYDVQVDSPTVVRRPGQVDVSFRITEGRPVIADSVAFEGADGFAGSGLLDDLPLQRGDRFSALARDAASDTLVQRLHNRGYAHADVFYRVLRPRDDPYNARVTFDVVPGPLSTYGSIDVQGAGHLSQRTVRRMLQFAPGDVYRDSDIEAARARLFGLDIIQSARVVPDLGASPDSVVPVAVLIQEGDAYRVRTGGGWSTAECLNLEARWTSRNFLGGARLLQLRGRVGNLLADRYGDALCNDSGSDDYARLTWVAALDLAQPWIFSTDNSLAASIFAERQTLPDIFIRRALGFQLAVNRSIDARTGLSVFYRPELSELDADDVLFCTGFLVCTPDDIVLLEGANWLAPVGLGFTRDRSNDLLNPRRGYRLAFDVEHAGGWTGSNFRYDRVVAEATRYDEMGVARV